MLGTYFGSIQVLLSLSNAMEAPEIFSRRSKSNFYQNAWVLTGMLSLLVVVISFFLSTKLFNYLISACTYFSLNNWSVNIIVYLIWLKRRRQDERFSSPLIWGKAGAYLTLILIAILTAVSLTVKDFRVGFYSAAGISILVSSAYLVWKREKVKLK